MSTIFISHSSQDAEAAKELARRLADQNHSSVFLDFDPEKGIVAGQSWERTLYRKLRACRGVVALWTDNYLNSKWCFAEVALARMEGKHIFALRTNPLGPDAKMPGILTEKQFIDLRGDPEEGYQRLWRGLKEVDLLGVAGEWDPNDPPYLGLHAFHEKHAPVFFGREEESQSGVELLERGAPGLIMVLGASGSGKSSLARAGILPRLRRDADRWLVVEPFRTGQDPFLELAQSLVQAYRRYAPDSAARAGSAESLRDRLQSAYTAPAPDAPEVEGRHERAFDDERVQRLIAQLEELRRQPPTSAEASFRKFLDWSLDDLHRICGVGDGPTEPPSATALLDIAYDLRRVANRRNAHVLLVVDQFEELLGQEEPDPRAGRFLTLLRASLEAENSPVMVLGTMRSDFLGTFQRHPALRGIDFGSLSLGPMKTEGMRRVIEEPARLGALTLESGLADRLMEDTETPDALPLLSFTLWVLWRDFREDGTLAVSEYEALGGLSGAIAREADALLEQGDEAALRRAFLRMTRLTEEGQYARQRVDWDAEELRPVHPLLELFVARRLLVTRAEGGTRIVEVAHEALLRSWKPLQTWLDDNRAELLLKQQIAREAKTWADAQRPRDNLWQGGRLQQAEELLHTGSLSGTDLDFVRTGVRRRTIRRVTLAGTALVIASTLTALTFQARRAARAAETAQRETSETILKFSFQSFDESDDPTCAISENVEQFGADTRSFYGLLCHLASVVSLSDLQRISTLDVFGSGPHLKAGAAYPLESYANKEFGHYNPTFVRWLFDNLIPSSESPILGPTTQRVYDDFVREQARIFYQVYRDLYHDEGYAADLAREYADYIASFAGPDTGFEFDSPGNYIQGRFDLYASATLRHSLSAGILQDTRDGDPLWREYYRYRVAAGFWLRRELDGTVDEFVSGLRKVLGTFDPEALDGLGDAESPVARAREFLVGRWADGSTSLVFEADGSYRMNDGARSGTWRLRAVDELIMDGEPVEVRTVYDPLRIYLDEMDLGRVQ